MPKYVAERALNMLDPNIKNPKFLILGVAYKPGVGDVRETPVSELRDHLLDLGAEVAWHDPMVTIWEGTYPVDLTWDCDAAILATNQPEMDLSQLIAKGIQILDCTNSLVGHTTVTSL
jgi:UDP-N-acetyl-D-glucosamine dehydrogenase